LAIDKPRNQPPLAIAVVSLTISLEDFSGREADGIFDRAVAVDERQPEALCKPPSNGRLPHAHQPHENDWSIELLG
jgi:hypothetical protein